MCVSASTSAPPDLTVVFHERAEARAILWVAGEYDLHEAVDVLQADAEASGLEVSIGQDAVQAIMAAAFTLLRAEVVPDPLPEPAARHSDAPNATVEALLYALRTDGLAALQRNQTRLLDLSPGQIATVVERLAELRNIYPKITDELILLIGELL